jgi:hypothetical protein
MRQRIGLARLSIPVFKCHPLTRRPTALVLVENIIAAASRFRAGARMHRQRLLLLYSCMCGVLFVLLLLLCGVWRERERGGGGGEEEEERARKKKPLERAPSLSQTRPLPIPDLCVLARKGLHPIHHHRPRRK